jgi:hypothetical protein
MGFAHQKRAVNIFTEPVNTNPIQYFILNNLHFLQALHGKKTLNPLPQNYLTATIN